MGVSVSAKNGFAANENFVSRIVSQEYECYGKLARLRIDFEFGVEITAQTLYEVGVLPSSFTPAYECFIPCGRPQYIAHVETNGKLNVRSFNNASSGGRIVVCGVYMI